MGINAKALIIATFPSQLTINLPSRDLKDTLVLAHSRSGCTINTSDALYKAFSR
jgi:fructoselysine-6-P-deglycase FrlB-like protein